jgi:DNA repair photolyase
MIYAPKGRAAEYAHLAINHYTGCSHGCAYCYVPQYLHMPRHRFQRDVHGKDHVLERLAKQAPKYAYTDKRVLLCFSCDPYQPIDRRLRLTRSVLLILKHYHIPFEILTKAGPDLPPLDFDLYGKDDAYAATLTFTPGRQSETYEPGAALPAERIHTLSVAHAMGIRTWVSLEPVIDPHQSLELIRWTRECVDLYKIGKLNHPKLLEQQGLAVPEVDWRTFGIQAIELCKRYNKSYYIKADLAKYLRQDEYCNSDTRCIDS